MELTGCRFAHVAAEVTGLTARGTVVTDDARGAGEADVPSRKSDPRTNETEGDSCFEL
jgi:hypothetical protein